MALIVQKFGGSSVADAESIRRVAKRVIETREAGNDVVVVVSAMGDTTDELLDLANAVTAHPTPRELDMLLTSGERISMALLAMAITQLGHKAVSFTGSQAGMKTDKQHGQAKIVDLDPIRVRKALDKGAIAIVAGFQGFNDDSGEVTTLGRGGSDTTAVALASALSAEVCEIFTDVDGVFTADPRVVPYAQKIDYITSEEMLELASSGAKVLYIRAVEFARRHGVKIHVRSSFNHSQGTIVYNKQNEEIGAEKMEEPIITGVATDSSEAKITVVGVPDIPGKAAEIFELVAGLGANIDMIVQNSTVADSARTDISFTMPHADSDEIVSELKKQQKNIAFLDVVLDSDIGKIAVVGAGMRTNAGVSAKLFRVLYESGINIEMISTSEIRISVVTRAKQLDNAARALHKAFGLDSESIANVYAGTGR